MVGTLRAWHDSNRAAISVSTSPLLLCPTICLLTPPGRFPTSLFVLLTAPSLVHRPGQGLLLESLITSPGRDAAGRTTGPQPSQRAAMVALVTGRGPGVSSWILHGGRWRVTGGRQSRSAEDSHALELLYGLCAFVCYSQLSTSPRVRSHKGPREASFQGPPPDVERNQQQQQQSSSQVA